MKLTILEENIFDCLITNYKGIILFLVCQDKTSFLEHHLV